jgi:RNA polymerase sigma factor (sigma-70 family)
VRRIEFLREAAMEQNGLRNVLKYLRRQAIRQGGGISDAMLLDRYAHSRDEVAFELLLWRHGPLVQNVCRRLLRNEHDVEDAFQATFAALACKARTIRRQHSAAPWLYRVAYRAALAARARSGRFTTLPTECDPVAAPDNDLLWRDLRAVMDDEVLKLGEKYRSVFVLCYLEGLTHGEAAVRLGCPEGTVHSRLATAKTKLRRGLERRGVTLSGTGMALEFATRHVGAPPTVQLIQETLTTAFSMAGSPVSGTVAKSSVVTLTKGVLFTMWMQSYAAPALVTLVLGLVGVGVVGLQAQVGTKQAEEPAKAQAPQSVGQAGKAATRPPEQVKADEAATRQMEEMRKLLPHLQSYHDDLSRRQYQKEAEYESQRRQLTQKLVEQEEALRRVEQQSSFERERERKALAFFEDKNSDLTLALDELRLKNGPDATKAHESELLALRYRHEQKFAAVSKKEEQRSQLLITLRLDVDQSRQRLRNLEEKWARSSSQAETQLADLQGRMFTLREQLEFPQVSINPRINSEVTPASRLENKLDQVIRELAEVKKLLAKPAGERE